LPDNLDVDVKLAGRLRKVGSNSLFAIRVDYVTASGAPKSVLFHGPAAGADLYDLVRQVPTDSPDEPKKLARGVDDILVVLFVLGDYSVAAEARGGVPSAGFGHAVVETVVGEQGRHARGLALDIADRF
jgi:hypothetical protein